MPCCSASRSKMKVASYAKAKAAADKSSHGGPPVKKAKAKKATPKKAQPKKAKACSLCGKYAKDIAALKKKK
jgi:hypothetical protein